MLVDWRAKGQCPFVEQGAGTQTCKRPPQGEFEEASRLLPEENSESAARPLGVGLETVRRLLSRVS